MSSQTPTKGIYYLGPGGYTAAEREDVLLNAPVVAVDVETVSLDDRTILGIGFSPNRDESFYYPIDNPYIPWRILTNPQVRKVYHNAHFDIKLLEEYIGARIGPIDDTMIMADLAGSQVLSLFDIVLELWGVATKTIQDIIGPKGKGQKTMLEVDYLEVVLKCCNDTKWTYRIWEHYLAKVPRAAYELDMAYMPLCMDIERRGMLVDMTRLEEKTKATRRDRDFYRGICRGMGFNPGSSQQVAAMLQYKGYRIPYNRKTGKPIMDEFHLREYYWDEPVAQLTILYRKANKTLTTYLEALPKKYLDEENRIHGNINLTNVQSGRTSRSNPNLQNQPPSVRDIYIPSPGNVFEERDLSQIELRELAYQMMLYTGDRSMWDLFAKELESNPWTITDMHLETANKIHKERKYGKAANFTIVYMGTEDSLYKNNGIPYAEGWQIIQDLKVAYPGIDMLIGLCEQKMVTDGYSETRMGRRRYVKPEQLNTPAGYAAALRELFNHTIQGSAGEILKQFQLRWPHYQVNMVHDSTLYDRPPDVEIPKDLSLDLAPYRTPMDAKVGTSWGMGDDSIVGVYG